MNVLRNTAPRVEAEYEPTAEDWAECDRIHAAMAAERLLGIELAPTIEDQQWWAEYSDTREARAAAEDAVDRADRERHELAELDRLLRQRRRDVADARGGWGGHASEGGP